MDENPLVQKYGRTLEPGQFIFQENDEGEHMFIIQEGQVQISRVIAGREVSLSILEKGDFFGEMAIVNRIRRTATAKALAHTVLLAFDRAGLEQMIEKNPKIALNIIDKLCRRLHSANSMVKDVATESSRQAIAAALHGMAQRDENLGTLQQIQEELGMAFHADQEEVSRLIAELVEKGALGRQGEILVLKDKGLLLKAAAAS